MDLESTYYLMELKGKVNGKKAKDLNGRMRMKLKLLQDKVGKTIEF